MALLLACLIWLVALLLAWPFVTREWWLPEPITALGRVIDQQMNWTFALTGAIFALAQFALGFAVWRFGRKREGPALYTPGNDRWELLWTSAGVILFLGLALTGYSAWAEARFTGAREAPGSPDRLIVEVVGQQFVWNMRYAGPDGRFGPTNANLIDDAAGNPLGVIRDHPDGEDDLVTPRLALPVNREVELLLRSKDVIHNFFVRELRLKLDTVPGLTGRLSFTPEKVGVYEIACSELCGLGHYRMRGFLEVMEPARFEAWLREQAAYLE